MPQTIITWVVKFLLHLAAAMFIAGCWLWDHRGRITTAILLAVVWYYRTPIAYEIGRLKGIEQAATAEEAAKARQSVEAIQQFKRGDP